MGQRRYKSKVSITLDQDLDDELARRSRSAGTTKSELINRLLYRALLSEDVEMVREGMEDVLEKIKEQAGLPDSLLLVILEILAYSRITYAQRDPEAINQAKKFAEAHIGSIKVAP